VRDARVIDEDIEALELAARRAEEGVDGVRVADVARMGEDFDPWGSQFPADFRERFLVACGEDQVAGFAGEFASDGQADAAGGAGDEGDLAA
jgi:hypothetical protein